MIAATDPFGHADIAATAAPTAVICAAIGIWRLDGRYGCGHVVLTARRAVAAFPEGRHGVARRFDRALRLT